MVENIEIINLIKLTIDHNSKQSKEAVESCHTEKDKLLTRAGYDEVINGHFDLLKIFVFIELIESNNLNIEYVYDLIDEHLEIINQELEDDSLSDDKRNNITYNKNLWESVKTKVNAYMELLSPV